MSKDRVSATVDEDVAAYLSQDHINTSGLINDLVKQYMDGGDGQAAILRLREEQIKSELEALTQQKESKQKELERLTESRKDVESGTDLSDEYDAILDDMEADGVHVWPNSQPVGQLVSEHDGGPEDIVEELKQRAAEQDRDILHTQFRRADMVRGTKGRNIGEVLGDE